jgi:hypothetical protein
MNSWLMRWVMALCVAGGAANASRLEFVFDLERDGFVTVVVEDTAGLRVRNLISEVPLDSGEHVVIWDVTTDSVLVDDSLKGVAPERSAPLVKGTYRLRGLIRDRVDLRYQFTVYNPGTPPWETIDGSGQWLADHSAPAGAVYVPESDEVIITAEVSESSAGMIWLDSTGRKTFEIDNVVGWDCPTVMTHDPVTGRVFGVIRNGDLWEFTDKQASKIGNILGDKMRGIAAHDNLVVVSKSKDSVLALVDVADSPRLLRFIPMPKPRGLAFDDAGRLLVLSDGSLYRGEITISGLVDADTLITGLRSPMGLTLDREGNIYVSLWDDTLYNIEVYDSTGAYLHAIGTPGPEEAGPYDSTHMVRPFGITIDGLNRLWVAEANYVPKRVSVWELDGRLVRYFLGPTKYGGGGMVCPCDSTRFFYTEERTRGSMEFALDWEKGTWDLKNILGRWVTAQTPYCHEGTVYLTNEHGGYPTAAPNRIELFVIDSGAVQPIATIGAPPDDSLLKTDPFASLWDPNAAGNYMYVWRDLNLDRKRQVGEVSFIDPPGGGVLSCSMDDAFGVTMHTESGIHYIPPERFDSDGVPEWDLAGVRTLSSFDGRAVRTLDGAVVVHGDPLRGVVATGEEWSYPNPWPGLHETWSHQQPPSHPGQIIGGTVWLYNTLRPRTSDVGDIVALNGNMGSIYLLSSDGLFVATLFRHFAVACEGLPLDPHRGSGRGWHYPRAQRGMLVNEVSLGEECFWPGIMQTDGGDIYVVGGHEHSSIVRVEGLESCRRISLGEVGVDSAALRDGARFELALAYDTPIRPSPRLRAPGPRPVVRTTPRRLIVEGGAQPFELRLYDAAGAVVRRIRSTRGDTRLVCELGRLPAGVYLYRLRHPGRPRTISGTVMVVR